MLKSQKKLKPIVPNFKKSETPHTINSSRKSFNIKDFESNTTFTTLPKTKEDVLRKLPSPPTHPIFEESVESENQEELMNHKLNLMLQQNQESNYPSGNNRCNKNKLSKKEKTQTPPPSSSSYVSSISSSSISNDDKDINEKNIFNSKRMRNRFLSKILMKSKKKIYKSASCFLTPFLLIKLILPDLPLFD